MLDHYELFLRVQMPKVGVFLPTSPILTQTLIYFPPILSNSMKNHRDNDIEYSSKSDASRKQYLELCPLMDYSGIKIKENLLPQIGLVSPSLVVSLIPLLGSSRAGVCPRRR